MSLRCQGYRGYREIGVPLKLNVDFILMGVRWSDSEEMSKAMAKIEQFLGGDVDLVKAVPDRPRCFHCGVLNDKEATICSQCGAPL